tara:strand:- start:320 stop:859 length:540 start_codon:yes stop_codon:yes gene_type:complete
MKTYEDFKYGLFESELNNWNEDLIEKASEWNTLDEESQQKILEGFQDNNEEIIAEWGPLDEAWGKALRTAGKFVRRLPGIRTGVELGMAGYRAAKGDWAGAGLSLGSAIPGPVGWGFVAADVARDLTKDNKKNQQNVATKQNQTTTTNQNPTPKVNRVSVGAKKAASGKLRLTGGRLAT